MLELQTESVSNGLPSSSFKTATGADCSARNTASSNVCEAPPSVPGRNAAATSSHSFLPVAIFAITSSHPRFLSQSFVTTICAPSILISLKMSGAFTDGGGTSDQAINAAVIANASASAEANCGHLEAKFL